jgi:hypothetical protein
MNPRTKPDPAGVFEHSEATEDLHRYQADPKYAAGMMDAIDFWQETASVDGLPAHWEHWKLFSVGSGDSRQDWRVYLKAHSKIRMGFAESKEGKALHLLMLVPTSVMSVSEACAELSKRMSGDVT